MSKWSSAFRDSRWQQKRLEVMQRDDWTCRSCGASGDGVTLNVHHVYYEAGKAPWDYKNELLITWCENCHKERHELQKNLLIRIADADIERCRIICTKPIPNYLMTLSTDILSRLSDLIIDIKEGGER